MQVWSAIQRMEAKREGVERWWNIFWSFWFLEIEIFWLSFNVITSKSMIDEIFFRKSHQGPLVTSLTIRFCPNQLFTESKQSRNHISLCEPPFLLHLNVTLPFHSLRVFSGWIFPSTKVGFTGDEKAPQKRTFQCLRIVGRKEAEFFRTFHNQRDRRFALFTRTTSGQTECGTAPRVMWSRVTFLCWCVFFSRFHTRWTIIKQQARIKHNDKSHIWDHNEVLKEY